MRVLGEFSAELRMPMSAGPTVDSIGCEFAIRSRFATETGDLQLVGRDQTSLVQLVHATLLRRHLPESELCLSVAFMDITVVELAFLNLLMGLFRKRTQLGEHFWSSGGQILFFANVPAQVVQFPIAIPAWLYGFPILLAHGDLITQLPVEVLMLLLLPTNGVCAK